jgi:hypothetical protein
VTQYRFGFTAFEFDAAHLVGLQRNGSLAAQNAFNPMLTQRRPKQPASSLAGSIKPLCLQADSLFFLKVVEVQLLQLDNPLRPDPDPMLDHQPRKLLSIDQH